MFINIENVYFKYRNNANIIIDNFNLEMTKGEVVCILGESGCGKSTMLRIIAGLEEPYKGKIDIGGQVVCDKDVFIEPEQRDVGMVFQDYALFPHMNVMKNIQYGLKAMSKKEKEDRAMEMLQLVNMLDNRHKYPYELSGGQQQRVAIARALAPNPSLLLLDEPFCNLDANLRAQIRTDLQGIIAKANITAIFVTHDQEDAKALADRVVIIEDGCLADRKSCRCANMGTASV